MGGGLFGSSYYALNIAKYGLNDKNATGLVGNALFFTEGSLILLSLGSKSGHDILHAHVHIAKFRTIKMRLPTRSSATAICA